VVSGCEVLQENKNWLVTFLSGDGKEEVIKPLEMQGYFINYHFHPTTDTERTEGIEEMKKTGLRYRT
jgi:hypothetical protein